MPFYEQYAPYRQDMSFEETAFVQEAIRTRGDTLFVNPSTHIQDGRVVMDDPELNAYAQIGYNRARSLGNDHMPTTLNLDQRFPGVDPVGKHCHVDMEFAQRLSRLENAAAIATGHNKDILTEFCESYRSKQGVLSELATAVDNTCKNIKAMEDAAKFCPHEQVSHALENGANQMAAHSPDIQEMNDIFTAMEQVAGLKSGPIKQETIDLYNDKMHGLGHYLYPNCSTGFYVKSTVPETLNIDFPNFDNVAAQNLVANPKYWGQDLSTIPLNSADSKALDACIARYAGGTVTNALDGLFGPVELSQGPSIKDTPQSNHRATLIIVDGKTVSEHMQEYYNSLKGNDIPPFTEWYTNNLKEMSGRIVAAGLMSGKRVEAFIPDHNGKLPDQPMMLHRTGYEPSPLKPVILTGWERFLNKFGFFKEKAAQAKAQQKHLDARERLKANYAHAQNKRLNNAGLMMKDMFFGDYLRKNNIPNLQTLARSIMSSKTPDPDNIDRSSATGACICMLAADGHNIRDIMDPTKLIPEKQAAGERYCTQRMINPTLVRLTDRNTRLTDTERKQMTAQLMNDITDLHPFTEADMILMNLPVMPQNLLSMDDKERKVYLKKALNDGPLKEAQQKQLAHLQALQANSDQNPLDSEQTQELENLTRQQQQWQDYQDHQKWDREYRQVVDKSGAKRVEILNQIGKEQTAITELLEEAKDNPKFQLNMLDPRIPRNLREGDNVWLGETFFRGQQALTKQFNNIMANTDLNNPAQRSAVMPMLASIADACFDISQDIKNDQIMLGYMTAAHQVVQEKAPNLQGQAAVDVTNRLVEKAHEFGSNMGDFCRILVNGDNARSAMIQPISDGSAQTHLSNLILEKEIMSQINPNKTLPFCSRIPSDKVSTALRMPITGNRQVAKYADDMNGGWRPDPKTIISGDFANAFTVTVNKLQPQPSPIKDNKQTLVLDNKGRFKIQRSERTIRLPEASITMKVASHLEQEKMNPKQPQTNRGGFRF